jgi:hypothetical protein
VQIRTAQYRDPLKKTTLIPLLVISHVVAPSVGYRSARLAMMNDVHTVTERPVRAVYKVLDGDTVVKMAWPTMSGALMLLSSAPGPIAGPRLRSQGFPRISSNKRCPRALGRLWIRALTKSEE